MNLENKFFYRLVNVLYYFGLLITTLVIIVFLYSNLKEHINYTVDSKKSHITCKSQHQSTFSLDIFNIDILKNNIGLYKAFIKREKLINLISVCSIDDLSLNEIRLKYPQYNSWTDQDLAEGLHEKYYSGTMSINKFYSKIGLHSTSDMHTKKCNDYSELLEVRHDSSSMSEWELVRDTNTPIDLFKKAGIEVLSLIPNKNNINHFNFYLEDDDSAINVAGIELTIYKSTNLLGCFVAIIRSLLYFVLCYSILNITRETFIYLAFSRKFEWDWLFIRNINRYFKLFINNAKQKNG